MSGLGLNDHHQSVILNYMRFARYQRTQNLKAIDYAFQDVMDSRLLEDTYTADEVRDLLTGLCKVVHGDVETELISSTHMTVLLLKQLFEQAEKWHLRLQPDLSELENREKVALVKSLEINESPILKPDKTPPSPTKVKLEPMAEVSGSLKLLKLEIERLKEDRSQLLEALQATKHKEHTYLGELNKLKKEFNEQQNEMSALKQLPQSSPSQLEEVEDQLSEVRNLMASNLQVSESNKQQLESELLSTKQKVAEVQAQLSLAEQELERKFSQTAAYTNMKKIMNKKNEQIKELRGRLLKYEPEETTIDEQN